MVRSHLGSSSACARRQPAFEARLSESDALATGAACRFATESLAPAPAAADAALGGGRPQQIICNRYHTTAIGSAGFLSRPRAGGYG